MTPTTTLKYKTFLSNFLKNGYNIQDISKNTLLSTDLISDSNLKFLLSLPHTYYNSLYIYLCLKDLFLCNEIGFLLDDGEKEDNIKFLVCKIFMVCDILKEERKCLCINKNDDLEEENKIFKLNENRGIKDNDLSKHANNPDINEEKSKYENNTKITNNDSLNDIILYLNELSSTYLLTFIIILKDSIKSLNNNKVHLKYFILESFISFLDKKDLNNKKINKCTKCNTINEYKEIHNLENYCSIIYDILGLLSTINLQDYFCQSENEDDFDYLKSNDMVNIRLDYLEMCLFIVEKYLKKVILKENLEFRDKNSYLEFISLHINKEKEKSNLRHNEKDSDSEILLSKDRDKKEIINLKGEVKALNENEIVSNLGIISSREDKMSEKVDLSVKKKNLDNDFKKIYEKNNDILTKKYIYNLLYKIFSENNIERDSFSDIHLIYVEMHSLLTSPSSQPIFNDIVFVLKKTFSVLIYSHIIYTEKLITGEYSLSFVFDLIENLLCTKNVFIGEDGLTDLNIYLIECINYIKKGIKTIDNKLLDLEKFEFEKKIKTKNSNEKLTYKFLKEYNHANVYEAVSLHHLNLIMNNDALIHFSIKNTEKVIEAFTNSYEFTTDSINIAIRSFNRIINEIEIKEKDRYKNKKTEYKPKKQNISEKNTKNKNINEYRLNTILKYLSMSSFTPFFNEIISMFNLSLQFSLSSIEYFADFLSLNIFKISIPILFNDFDSIFMAIFYENFFRKFGVNWKRLYKDKKMYLRMVRKYEDEMVCKPGMEKKIILQQEEEDNDLDKNNKKITKKDEKKVIDIDLTPKINIKPNNSSNLKELNQTDENKNNEVKAPITPKKEEKLSIDTSLIEKIYIEIISTHVTDFLLSFLSSDKKSEIAHILNMIPFIPYAKKNSITVFRTWRFVLNNFKDISFFRFFCIKTPALTRIINVLGGEEVDERVLKCLYDNIIKEYICEKNEDGDENEEFNDPEGSFTNNNADNIGISKYTVDKYLFINDSDSKYIKKYINMNNVALHFTHPLFVIMYYSERQKVLNYNYTGIIEYITDTTFLQSHMEKLKFIMDIIHIDICKIDPKNKNLKKLPADNNLNKKEDEKVTEDECLEPEEDIFITKYIKKLLEIYVTSFESTRILICIIIRQIMKNNYSPAFSLPLHYLFNDVITKIQENENENTDRTEYNLVDVYCECFLSILKLKTPHLYRCILLNLSSCKIIRKTEFENSFNENKKTNVADCYFQSNKKVNEFMNEVEIEFRKVVSFDEKTVLENYLAVEGLDCVKLKNNDTENQSYNNSFFMKNNGYLSTKKDIKLTKLNEKDKNEKDTNFQLEKSSDENSFEYKYNISWITDTVYIRHRNPLIINHVLNLISKRIIFLFTYHDLLVLTKTYNILNIQDSFIDKILYQSLNHSVNLSIDPFVYKKISIELKERSPFFSFFYSNIYFIASSLCKSQKNDENMKFPGTKAIYKFSIENIVKIYNIFVDKSVFKILIKPSLNRLSSRLTVHRGYVIDLNYLEYIDILVILKNSSKKDIVDKSLLALKSTKKTRENEKEISECNSNKIENEKSSYHKDKSESSDNLNNPKQKNNSLSSLKFEKEIVQWMSAIIQILKRDLVFTEMFIILFEMCKDNILMTHTFLYNLRSSVLDENKKDKSENGCVYQKCVKDIVALCKQNKIRGLPEKCVCNIQNDAIGDQNSFKPESIGTKNEKSEKKEDSGISDSNNSSYYTQIDFFDELTQISTLMIPHLKLEKSVKKQKINNLLSSIQVPFGIYLPTDTKYIIVGVVENSGRVLQSAAKVPFMASFYCIDNSVVCKCIIETIRLEYNKTNEKGEYSKEISGTDQKCECIKYHYDEWKKNEQEKKKISVNSHKEINNKNFYDLNSPDPKSRVKKLTTKILFPDLNFANFLKSKVSVKELIFKSGDDCRQDMLAIQIMSKIHQIFKKSNLDIFLYPYKVIATGPGTGIIEVVPNAITRDQMGREKINNLLNYFTFRYGFKECDSYKKALSNFTSSLAGYSLITYFLNIKDRHNANIMITDEGYMVHIDFGFILEISPGNMNIEGPLKLTAEIYDLLVSGNMFDKYIELMVKGFLILRRNSKELVYILDIFEKSGLPCFRDNAIENFMSRFMFHLNDKDASEFVKKMVHSSTRKIRTWMYDKYQNMTNNIAF